MINFVMIDAFANRLHGGQQRRTGLERPAQIDALRCGEQFDRENVGGIFDHLYNAFKRLFNCLASADDFLILAGRLAANPDQREIWRARIHSIFCHAENGTASLRDAVRLLANNSSAELRPVGVVAAWTVSDKVKGIFPLRISVEPDGGRILSASFGTMLPVISEWPKVSA